MTKRKRYWILMPPFLIATLMFFYVLPNPYKGLSFISPLIFWIVLWFWNFFSDKTKTT